MVMVIEESSAPAQNAQSQDSTSHAQNSAFKLTTIDVHQLSLTDAEYTPHDWENLKHLISTHKLEELKRFPSSLRAYLSWSADVKQKYGSVTSYILSERLHWKPLNNSDGSLSFYAKSDIPFEDPEDFRILRNDWPYGLADGISHVVVWLKKPLDANDDGSLKEGARERVEAFLDRTFREPAGESTREVKILWFKNTTNLQSVRGLEHIHVLIRDVQDDILQRWMQ